jgi:hypothetical protein
MWGVLVNCDFHFTGKFKQTFRYTLLNIQQMKGVLIDCFISCTFFSCHETFLRNFINICV